jgi:7-carboxy-7-deazaguanine synthase
MRLLHPEEEGFPGGWPFGPPPVRKIKISEIFYSIQGEGVLAGTPSVFVRTSGCNLRCVWCDTPYASWKPEGEDRTLGSILGDVRKRWATHVVVTGGEPMIVDGIVELTQGLKEIDQHITIETAGTVYQPVTCDLMSISPKLASSTPVRREGGKWAAQHERLRYQPDVLRKLMSEYQYQLKFVVSTREDLPEIGKIIEETGADRARTLLMAEGTTPEEIYERAQWIVPVCKMERVRYSPRLHIDLWGDERGR